MAPVTVHVYWEVATGEPDLHATVHVAPTAPSRQLLTSNSGDAAIAEHRTHVGGVPTQLGEASEPWHVYVLELPTRVYPLAHETVHLVPYAEPEPHPLVVYCAPGEARALQLLRHRGSAPVHAPPVQVMVVASPV